MLELVALNLLTLEGDALGDGAHTFEAGEQGADVVDRSTSTYTRMVNTTAAEARDQRSNTVTPGVVVPASTMDTMMPSGSVPQ